MSQSTLRFWATTSWSEACHAAASPTPGKGAAVGRVTVAQLREIAATKMKDMNANDVEAAMLMIEGSARSMGIQVRE